jgi:hypothetical protein
MVNLQIRPDLTRKNGADEILLGERRIGLSIELLPLGWVCLIDQAKSVMFCIDVGRPERNQPSFVKDPASIDDEVSDTTRSWINHDPVKDAQPGTILSLHF